MSRIENLVRSIKQLDGEKSSIVVAIEKSSTALVELESTANKLSHFIRSIRFSRWDSVNGCYRNLRYHLVNQLLWGETRLAVRFGKQEIDSLYTIIGQKFCQAGELRRESRQGGWGRHGYEETERQLRFTDMRLRHSMPTMQSLEAQNILTAKWQTQLDGLSELWDSIANFHNRFPESSIGQRRADQLDQLDGIIPSYRAVKKYLPIGGRLAYSVLMACRFGKLDTRLANEHAIGGWHADATGAIRWTLNQLYDKPERSGKASSFKAGLEVLSSKQHWGKQVKPLPDTRTDDERRKFHNCPPNWNKRLTVCHQQVDTSKVWACSTGSMQYLSPSLVKLVNARQAELERNRRLVLAIMGLSDRQDCANNVLTVFTDRPIRLGSDVYMVAATWRAENHTVSGYCFLRSSWPDMVHQPHGHIIVGDNGTIRSYKDGEPITDSAGIPFNIQTVEQFVSSTANYPVLVSKVESACHSFFQRRADEKLRRLTFNQRRAHVVKAIRRLPIVEFVTSLQAGNCDVGTRQFMAQLGIDLSCQSIEGKRLAKLWYKANYPQQDRLYGTIQRQAIRLQSEMAVNHAQ